MLGKTRSVFPAALAALLLFVSPAAALVTAAAEYLVTLPCLLGVFPLFRQVHRRTTVDY